MNMPNELPNPWPDSILKRSKLDASDCWYDIMGQVGHAHKLPYTPTPYQVEVVERYGWRLRAGYFAEVGTGKTGMSTFSALYQRMQNDSKIIVVGPPILCRQWAKWLRRFTRLSTLIYEGSPAQRSKLRPERYSAVVM